jgi:hypothetical protein
MKKHTVYHVGTIDPQNITQRPKTSYSLEGSGLSVSVHPNEWRKIAKLPGDMISLTKNDSTFYTVKAKDKKKILEWCVENDFLNTATKFRVSRYDEELGEAFMEFDTKEEALNEADEEDQIETVNGYVFGSKGITYWNNFCSSKISNDLAEAYAPIFYAEAMGYDGVWWNETLDVANYSAPRGVIFQSKLNEWKIA